ncbi:hypothetical protein JB92DRAFT_2868817 [Gautieria morchelliformis]|nr:hypothetical protein JB92DRAFT_2868817 [Gautieria morchelliformis]
MMCSAERRWVAVAGLVVAVPRSAAPAIPGTINTQEAIRPCTAVHSRASVSWPSQPTDRRLRCMRGTMWVSRADGIQTPTSIRPNQLWPAFRCTTFLKTAEKPSCHHQKTFKYKHSTGLSVPFRVVIGPTITGIRPPVHRRFGDLCLF